MNKSMPKRKLYVYIAVYSRMHGNVTLTIHMSLSYVSVVSFNIIKFRKTLDIFFCIFLLSDNKIIFSSELNSYIFQIRKAL